MFQCVASSSTHRRPAASMHISCRRCRHYRRRRGWSKQCCPPPAAWICQRRTWLSWRPRMGWSRSPARSLCRWARRWARSRYSSGTGQSSPPAGCWRCHRSSRAGQEGHQEQEICTQGFWLLTASSGAVYKLTKKHQRMTQENVNTYGGLPSGAAV